MGNKAVMVISFEVEDEDSPLQMFQNLAQDVRKKFPDTDGLTLHVAIRESAQAVLDVFNKEQP